MTSIYEKKALITPLFACDERGGFGNKGRLPWPSLKSDIEHFWSTLTYKPHLNKKVVIMGRKTWESLPKSKKPIPNIVNVVISSSMDVSTPDVKVMKDLKSVFEYLDEIKEHTHNYLIGGVGLIEELFIQHKDRWSVSIITRVKGVFESDVKINIDLVDKMKCVYIAPYVDNSIEYAIYHYINPNY